MSREKSWICALMIVATAGSGCFSKSEESAGVISGDPMVLTYYRCDQSATTGVCGVSTDLSLAQSACGSSYQVVPSFNSNMECPTSGQVYTCAGNCNSGPLCSFTLYSPTYDATSAQTYCSSNLASGGGGGGGGGGGISTTTDNLAGTWYNVGGCTAVGDIDVSGGGDVDYVKLSFEFTGNSSGGTLNLKYLYYDDVGCSTTPIRTDRYSGTYAFQGESSTASGAAKIDLTYTGVYIMSHTNQMTNTLNLAAYCTKTDWSTAVEKTVTNLGACVLPNSAYDLVKIYSNNLTQFYGGDYGTGNGSSSGTRPTAIGSTPSFQR